MTFQDQLGFNVELKNFPPKRIVSLVPSQTELLFDLGLDEEVVGLTYFCVHPKEKFKEKTKIGGTKQVKKEIVNGLEPDLIIANKEENEKDQVEALKENYPVWVSDVFDLDSALEMIKSIGELVGKKEAGAKMVNQIGYGFKDLPSIEPKETLYLIWRNPYMTVGGDTFIHYMLNRIGLKNLLQDFNRYPEIGKEKIRELDPQLILLSSEPYPFKEKHKAELNAVVPDSEIQLVDGSMFSWYGSRMLKAVAYFQEWVKNFKEPANSNRPA